MRAKFILPSLTEAKGPFWRPIKYSLFPPLGLATLAGHMNSDDDVELVDEHVEEISLDDAPDLVVIQVYITNAYRAYALADHYRGKGCHVILGGLHVTALPHEASRHADTIVIGPGEEVFSQFLEDFRRGRPRRLYYTLRRSFDRIPDLRRDLIKRELYLVPNSLVVSRGCPHHCDFCYKDAFFLGGRSFYTQRVDRALAEIESLSGRHLYFLDDHLLGHRYFASQLFEGMRGMGRLFQGAATVDSVLRGDLIEKAAEAGLRSLFVGFETLNSANLKATNKRQHSFRDYRAAIRRLSDLGVMINGSFVFGMDEDDGQIFQRTVDWALEMGLTTATFHIQTPYPGTRLFDKLKNEGRLLTENWDRYNTREVVFQPNKMTAEVLKTGYDEAYRSFYKWSSILRSSLAHADRPSHAVRQFCYSAGWKKFEPLWNAAIKLKQLGAACPLLETLLMTERSAATHPAKSRHCAPVKR
ncbi:MAG: radical SAM protein [Candidatus Thiodiazotropha endolucinida]